LLFEWLIAPQRWELIEVSGAGSQNTQTSAGRIEPLDGVRGIAILAIMAFHSGVPGLDIGGFFSQDAFFVLSGMLITLILLREWNRSQSIRIGRFYAGRVRRLIPALLVMLIGVALYVQFVAPSGQYPGFRGDALAVLGYFSNWHFVATGSNYFVLSAAPSLLTHTWSLAIEEQFYLIWPLILITVMWGFRKRGRTALTALFCVSFGGALVSTGWMAFLYRSGATTTRLYYGTDTHAQSILVGCALGTLLAIIKQRRGIDSLVPVASAGRTRRIISLGGLAAAGGLAWLWTHASGTGAFTYQGGFLVGALLTAFVLASASSVPSGLLARALSFRVLRYVGTISYGMYLWYFPIFQYVDGARTGLTGFNLFIVRVAIDIAIATCSYYLVELPIRRGTPFRFESPGWARRVRRLSLLFLTLGATIGIVIATTTESSVAVGLPTASTINSRSASSPQATKLLMIGDSTSLTLAIDLPPKGKGWNVAIDSQGVEGCGVAIGPLVREDGATIRPGPPCDSSTPVDEQWPAQLKGFVATDRPNVVALLAGRWEVADWLLNGHWTNILDPTMSSYVEKQLMLAVQEGTAGGAHMVLLTAPCYSSGEQPDGTPWPNDSAKRLKAYNRLLYKVAAQHPQKVSVVNLNGIVCPAGKFETTIDNVKVRAPDGIHFPFFKFGDSDAEAPDTLAQVNAFRDWIGPRLMPHLVAHASGN
jgi:peptidoglycan/LPS O-acetylase OafA/YrhL